MFFFTGQVIGVHVNTSRPDKDEEFCRLLEMFRINQENDATLANCTSLVELNQQEVYLLKGTPAQSILFYFYCKTSHASNYLFKSVQNGHLRTLMGELLRNLFGRKDEEAQLEIESVSLDKEDEELCYQFTQTSLQSVECDTGENLMNVSRELP